LGTPVDLSGRGTVLPSPDLDMDEMGVPESIAWDVYHPFVVRRLVRSGVPRVEAALAAHDRTEMAKKALVEEMGARPVLATRYPVLHRYGVAAFRPKLVAGSAILSNNFVSKGYNLDHDGDTFTVNVPLSDEAVNEAYEKLLPSKNLFSPATMKVSNPLPNMEYQQGLHALTSKDEGNPPVEFHTLADAKRAKDRGEINFWTRVHILHHT
jgi:DNA-directed RNA polymerase subunit beta'